MLLRLQCHQQLFSAMTQVMQDIYGNPSSIHSHGRQAGKLLREARQDLAKLLGTKPQHIFFHCWRYRE